MPDAPKPPDEQLEEIVAYLDGELSPDDAARVERRLAADEGFRQQLQSVDRAWNALDELPLATVDDKFSRTTMTMAVKAAADELRAKTMALPLAERRRRWSTAVTAVVAAVLGFLAFRLARTNPNSEIAYDLPVIDNYDIYSQVADVDFLRALRREMGSQFQDLAGASQELQARVERFHIISDPDKRDAWLRALVPEERTNLRAKFNRFRDLSPDEQQRMRDLNAQIAAPDAEELRETLLAYQQWLRGLPPSRQFELRDMPVDQRIDAIKQWAAEMRDDSQFALSEEELRALFAALRQPLLEIRDAAREPDRTENQGKRDRQANRDRKGDAARNRPPNFLSQPMFQYRRELTERLSAQRGRPEPLYAAVNAGLPERTREPFDKLTPRAKADKLVAWMRQYAALQGEISQQDLERFFSEDLDVATRAELLSLPPGEMEQALRWRYRRQPNSGFGGDRWMWGAPRGRQGWTGPWRQAPRPGPPEPGQEFGRAPQLGPGQQPPPPFGPPDGFGGPRPEDGERPFRPRDDDRRGPPRRAPLPRSDFGGPPPEDRGPGPPPRDGGPRRPPLETER
jgi:hypothetical protein